MSEQKQKQSGQSQSMDVENPQEESKEELSFLGSMEILQLVKTSQSQNGLKHGDYRRYRRYCTQKVKRVRKAMKFSFGHGKFVKKNLEQEKPNDPKLLLAVLYEAEHDWAYGMDLKQTLANKADDQVKRMKFHARKKFKKAFYWARVLENICKKRTEKKCSLESEAYSCYMGGLYYHEHEQWEQALSNYIKSRQIYSEIVKICDSLQIVVFSEKIEQLDQAIRYCYHQSGGSMMDTVDNILQKFQKGSIEHDTLEKKNFQGEQYIDIEYLGEKLPIKNNKVIIYYNKIEDQKKKIVELNSKKQQVVEESKEKLSNVLNNQDILDQLQQQYIELFSYFDDAIRVVVKEKEDAKTTEGEKAVYQTIINYFTLQKSQIVMERNELLIKTALHKFNKEDGINNLESLSSKKAFKQKLTRPAEIVKLCDNLLLVVKQIMDIERGNQSLNNFRKYDAIEMLYKAIRCLYVSCVYIANQKFKEAVSLLQYCENVFLSTSVRKLDEIKQFVDIKIYQESVEFVKNQIKVLKVKTKIQYFQSQIFEEEQISEKIQDLGVQNKQQPNTIIGLIKANAMADKGSTNIQINKINNMAIIELPPKPQLCSCKPIFFDLGYNNLKYPSFDKKVKADNKGGFWNKLNFFKK